MIKNKKIPAIKYARITDGPVHLIVLVAPYTLDGFYASLTGVLGTLVALNPYTTIVSAVLYILTAIATVEATKTKYRN